MDNLIPLSKEKAEDLMHQLKEKVYFKIGYIPTTTQKIRITEIEVSEYQNIEKQIAGYIVLCHGIEINTGEYVNGEIREILNTYLFE